jgi:hypothetical protein
MIPVVRTAAGILRGGFERVVALGVLHRTSRSNIDKEFSLDGFRDILDCAVELSGKTPPMIEEFYLPRNRDLHQDIEGTVSDLKILGTEIARNMDDRTAMVMTGDLVHYGHGYGIPDPVEDPPGLINRWINEDLDEAYRIRDYTKYLPRSFERMSDHGPVAITAGTVLGRDLNYRIISSELSDYSTILQTASPTIVASVFYGAFSGNL